MLYSIKDLKIGQYFNFNGSNVEYIIEKIDRTTITYRGANGLHTYTGFTITDVFLKTIKIIEDLEFKNISSEDIFYFRKSSNNKSYKIKVLEKNGVYIYDLNEPEVSLYLKEKDFKDIAISA